jgi:hypothetical protein
MKTRLLAALAAALTCLAGAAGAADLPKGGMSVKEVQAWLIESGYKAALAKDSQGDASLKSETSGVSFDIHFYDCEKDRCASLQFIAGFDLDEKLDMAKVNAWNDSKRYVNCFLDDEGDPWFTYDVNLSPGGTREGLDDELAIWIGLVPDMKAHIGW